MSSFSLIMQDPLIRDLVQSRTLMREFHQALIEETAFRGVALPVLFEGGLGDSRTFTRSGDIEPDQAPIKPGQDAKLANNTHEQWDVSPVQRGRAIEAHMPTSALALANLLMDRTSRLGRHAGRTMSRVTRTTAYQAALSGRTVTSAAASNTATVSVKHLNGLTKARKNDGTAVRYQAVSSANPLAVKVFDTGATAFVSRSIIGFSTDVAGDEVGPGSITLDANVTISGADFEIIADDASHLVRAGHGAGLVIGSDTKGVHDVASSDVFKMSDIRAMVQRLRAMNVPTFLGGYYKGFLDSASEAQLFADTEAQRLLVEVPGHAEYKELALGALQGVIWYRAEECPQSQNVSSTFAKDPVPLETTNTGSVKIHRPIVCGAEFLEEHYIDLAQQITDAGIIGKVGEFNLSENGIEMNVDRIRMVTRPPLDRLQQMFGVAWNHQGDVVAGTDGVDGDSGGDKARHKRAVVCEHGE